MAKRTTDPAAPVEQPAQPTVIAARTIEHDGVRYEEGAAITLDEAAAAVLLACGAATEPASAEGAEAV
jgi:hypothetical protein